MPNKYELVYKTSTTPFFPLCLLAQNYSNRNFSDIFGLSFSLPRSVVCVVDKGTVNWFLPKQCNVVSKELLKEFFSSPRYLRNLKAREKKLSGRLLFELKTPIKQLLKDRVLNKDGEKKLRKIFDLYVDYGCLTDMPGFLFQLYYTDQVKKEFFSALGGKNQREKGELFNLMFSSFQKTNYERFLSRVYSYIFQGNGSENLKKIASDFYWVIHDYFGDIIDFDYLKKEVQKLKARPQSELKSELKEAEERIRRIKEAEKKLPKDILRKIKIIQQILYLYNERKKQVLSRVNVYLRRIVEQRFPKASFSELKKLYQLTPEEILKLLKGEVVSDIAQRNERWVYELDVYRIKKGDLKYFSLVQVKRKTDVLLGTPACAGKAKGVVNMILNISQIPNFKQGDILVAPFTNVSYLPVMRKAKAILTETGGITSHAAIVSRELKKPCIIGIKDLIAALKDGDRVEIDASEGKVKVLR